MFLCCARRPEFLCETREVGLVSFGTRTSVPRHPSLIACLSSNTTTQPDQLTANDPSYDDHRIAL